MTIDDEQIAAFHMRAWPPCGNRSIFSCPPAAGRCPKDAGARYSLSPGSAGSKSGNFAKSSGSGGRRIGGIVRRMDETMASHHTKTANRKRQAKQALEKLGSAQHLAPRYGGAGKNHTIDRMF